MVGDPFVVTIPVRGVVVDNPSVTLERLFGEPWTLIGPDQYGLLAAAKGRNESVLGNVNSIAKRLSPSSLLLVRYYPGQRSNVWDETIATRVLAALNMAFLLSDVLVDPPRPRPVFRARYAEYCDLPLAFDARGTKSVGHTSRLGLLAGDLLPRLHIDAVTQLVSEAPASVRAVLSGARLDSRQSRLADGMVNILGAFETLSTGAFVARLVSAAECLLDSQVDASRGSWSRVEARLEATVKSDVIKQLLEVRHRYTHAGSQPENDVASLRALAMAVECWGVVDALYRSVPDHGDVEVLLDCASLARQARSNTPSVLAEVVNAVPAGPSTRVEWVRQWLGLAAT